MFRLLLWFFLAGISFSACKSPASFSHREAKSLESLIMEVEARVNAQSAWVFRDAGTGTVVFSRKGEKYFTPASNTKILTLLVADKLLPDTLPGLIYFYKKDTLFFRGTGDPTFLHPDFSGFQDAFTCLSMHEGPVVFDYSNFKDDAYGAGWMWDDFSYAFQAEKAPLPLYGNVVQFKKDSLSREMQVAPPYFEDFVIKEESATSITRLPNGNLFFAPGRFDDSLHFEKFIPFKWSPVLVQQMLEDSLQKSVFIRHTALPDSLFRDTIFSAPKDTVFTRLMQISDNHIAEQLLLMCAQFKYGAQETNRIIGWALDSLLINVPQPVKWADGSGISRYNLLTPETISMLVFQLWQEMGEDRFRSIFPAGGISGTIASFYKSDPPYVFAKTGTLRYVHNLSGIVYTSSGKPLVFSFMHNNFPGGSIDMKREMEKVLEFVKEEY